MPIDAKDINFEENPHKIESREFHQTGDSRYRLVFKPVGIIFEIDRLRRDRHELTGEFSARVNGNFPSARKYFDDILTAGDLNLSSVQARERRAKLIGERAGASKVDWLGCLDEFAARVITAERRGKPAVVLAECEQVEEDTERWLVDDFPVLRSLPMVVFGDSGSGKSMFVLWLAGRLAQDGINVLYADWELSQHEHRKRFGRLFRPMPTNVFYARCDRSLRHDVERLVRLVEQHKIQYVICDSIGFAVDGPAESHEAASEYFRAIRQLGVGTLSIAHIPKQTDDSRDAQIYGSSFFKHGGRSIWFVDAAKDNPHGQLRFGLYHRKTNVGQLLVPRAYVVKWEGNITTVEPIQVGDVSELSASLPLIDRLKRTLAAGPKKLKDIADSLGVSQDACRKAFARHEDTFVKVGAASYALKTDRAPIGRSEEF